MKRLPAIAAQLGLELSGLVLRGPHTRCLLALALADLADCPFHATAGQIRLIPGDL